MKKLTGTRWRKAGGFVLMWEERWLRREEYVHPGGDDYSSLEETATMKTTVWDAPWFAVVQQVGRLERRRVGKRRCGRRRQEVSSRRTPVPVPVSTTQRLRCVVPEVFWCRRRARATTVDLLSKWTGSAVCCCGTVGYLDWSCRLYPS